ncbi:MAG: chitosanase [Syntrophobacterales bacterium]|nr:chitosanase [Syntrophobacterales bacterium]
MMGVERSSISSLYHIKPEQLIVKLRQINTLQRELFFMETLGGTTISSHPSQLSFASTLRQIINSTSTSAKPKSDSLQGAMAAETEGSNRRASLPQDYSPPREGISSEVSEGSNRGLAPTFNGKEIGALSRRFESKEDPLSGVATIGYDSRGGTSYGIYQLSSRQGSVSQFIKFLEERKPEWAERLKASGDPNTGGTDGSFPHEWKAIAKESPEEFARLQHEFIRERYFEPVCAMIKNETGIDIKGEPPALQEMVWSMAVQHGVGGAVSIFKKALSDVVMNSGEGIDREEMVERIYEIRATKFSSSSPRVRQAVLRRFEAEKALVLSGLETSGGFSQWS